jgi:dTDP-N-acetylfucosamine:lipid II N-acetylfucosaminyltransferase
LAQLDGSFMVFVPLAYGPPAQREIVLRAGERYFGERFIPMLELVPLKEYLVFLQSIDVAVFNHRRQQAMGNSISLLGMGKKLFIRRQTPQWELFTSMGVDVSAFDNGLHATPQDKEVSKSNSALIAERFSESTLSQQWTALLRD